MQWKHPLPSRVEFVAAFASALLFLGAAQPPAAPLALAPQGEICPATFHATTLPCCANTQGGFDVCAVTMSVSPSSGANCNGCSFSFDVTVVCASCGVLRNQAESGIVCVSREQALVPCPDGGSSAVVLNFECGFCQIDPQGQ